KLRSILAPKIKRIHILLVQLCDFHTTVPYQNFLAALGLSLLIVTVEQKTFADRNLSRSVRQKVEAVESALYDGRIRLRRADFYHQIHAVCAAGLNYYVSLNQLDSKFI